MKNVRSPEFKAECPPSEKNLEEAAALKRSRNLVLSFVAMIFVGLGNKSTINLLYIEFFKRCSLSETADHTNA